MSVESTTAGLSKTSLNDTNGTTVGAGGDPINASQNEAVIASAAEGRRLYIGNLAYATTEGELKDFFKDYLVETTSIPTNPRTTRPVGYAFVDVSTPSEAERAIADLNGKTILDRKVSVQLARKPEPAGAAAPAAPAATEGEGEEGTRRRTSTRGRGRARGRGGRKAGPGRDAQAGSESTNGPTNVPGQVLPLTDDTTESKATPTASAPGAVTVDTAKAAQPRAPRPARKQRGPPEDGIASKTKVMVANLPYEMGEDKLMELFAEYKPSSAKIALRPIPKFMVKKLQERNEPRKGRGFGFITLASEELQQKACQEMNGKQIDGREIAVKVAIDSPGKENDVDALVEKNAPEAAAADATPAA